MPSKHCSKCGKSHASIKCSAKVVNKLSNKGFPTHAKRYPEAHRQADDKEKDKFGARDYNKLKKIDSKLSKHELAGKNLKSGKIEVSKKIPKSLRSEVKFHEKTENKILTKKKK